MEILRGGQDAFTQQPPRRVSLRRCYSHRLNGDLYEIVAMPGGVVLKTNRTIAECHDICKKEGWNVE